MLRYFIMALMVANQIDGNSAAKTVYRNGKIYTVDKSLNDWSTEPKDVMVVEGDKIVFIGTQEGAAQGGFMNGEKEVVDLEGRTILPGIHDIHMHPLEASNAALLTCKLDRTVIPEDVTKIIEACAPFQIGTEWVLGYGHSIVKLVEHIFAGGRDPKFILDDALPADQPCALAEESGHSIWVNSEALRRANIDKDTPNPPGGIIMKNPITGEPNGIILENAAYSIMDLALDPSQSYNGYDISTLNYLGLEYTMNEIAKHGITSICDARVFWKRGHLDTWNQACNNGVLKARTILDLWAYPSGNDAQQIAKLKEMYDPNPNPNCNMKQTQIKFFSDGLIESFTAALLAKYEIDLHLPGLEGNVGLNFFTESRLKTYIEQLQSFGDNKGFDVHIHAIGDRGVRESLNALEASKINGTRHRITHIELLSLQDVPRFKELNVVADFQTAGYWALPSYYLNELNHTIGYDRASTSYMLLKTVSDTGAKTTLSSDWPVASMNPFVGIGQAVDKGPQSVTVKKAIEMYTINAAYVMRQEDITGSLEAGKAADFIIIDQDILTIDKSMIKDTKVNRTVLAGEVTFG